MDGSTRHGWVRRRRTRLVAATLLVVAIAITPALAGFKSGTYSGTTSQAGQNLQLSVNKAKTKVIVVFFEFDAPPCGGMGGLQYAGLEAKIKKSGKFKALSPGDGFYGFVKGKFKGSKASGTAKYHWEEQGCDAGDVTWTAEKAQ
jgi:hypothetical protein